VHNRQKGILQWNTVLTGSVHFIMKQALVQMFCKNPPIFPPKQSEISQKIRQMQILPSHFTTNALFGGKISHLPTVHAIFRRQIE